MSDAEMQHRVAKCSSKKSSLKNCLPSPNFLGIIKTKAIIDSERAKKSFIPEPDASCEGDISCLEIFYTAPNIPEINKIHAPKIIKFHETHLPKSSKVINAHLHTSLNDKISAELEQFIRHRSKIACLPSAHA